MIGASPRRKEDRRLLVGGGRFVDDLTREGLLHLAVVRSVNAHARIAKIRLAEARALPGVVAAWSAADLPEAARPMPNAYGAVRKGRPWSQPILAHDRVRGSAGSRGVPCGRRRRRSASAGPPRAGRPRSRPR